MKVAIVGNCTVDTIAGCLEAITDCEIETFWAQPSKAVESALFRERLATFDVVCAHLYRIGPFARAALEQEARRVIYMPTLHFGGFHPDNLVIPNLKGPMGFNHSGIVVAGFLLGLPARRTARLFNRYVYASLGYFERFEEERRRLLAHAAEFGFDLATALEALPRPFVHDVQHPTYEAIATTARPLAEKLGLTPRPVDFSDPAVRAAADRTRYNAIWPVYPQIAVALGLPPEPRIVFRFEGREADERLLGVFVQQSYALYREADRATLEAVAAVERDVLSLELMTSC